MLIPCDKHTKDDLALWSEYEEAFDAPRAATQALSLAEEKACYEIDRFSKNGGCYISVSWGKDSVVVADLAMRNGLNIPIASLYCKPSHNPYCDTVRDIFLHLYPAAVYHEQVIDYGDIYSLGLPSDEQDKATNKIYFKGFKAIGDIFGNRYITGIRRVESAARRLRICYYGLSSPNTCAPIGWWKTNDVFAYLYKYNLPTHPNYAMLGGGRWKRENIRVSEIGDFNGEQMGRCEWEEEYYSDFLHQLRTPKKIQKA